MVKINSIYIHGYRNIVNTKLNLLEKLSVLIAPNNYGKTNVLHSINFAAELISSGEDWQENMIRANGYLSDNKDNPPESFKFSIGFLTDGRDALVDNDWLDASAFRGKSKMYNVKYEFDISPKKGVIYECLTVGNDDIFIRKNDVLSISEANNKYGRFNLVVSNTFWPSEKIEMTVFTRITRRVFANLEGILSDDEGQFNEKPQDRENKNISYLFNLMKRERGRPSKDKMTLMEEYQRDFNRLFPSIHSFLIRDVRSGNEIVRAPIDSDGLYAGYYKILFDTETKRNKEMFSRLSTGTRRIFSILLAVYRSKMKPIMCIEELENGIHPMLHGDMLNLLDRICENAKVILTSHSPAIIRNFGLNRNRSFYVGIPNKDGYATFLPIDKEKLAEIDEKAASLDMSMGELLFDMMYSGSEDREEELRGWLKAG